MSQVGKLVAKGIGASPGIARGSLASSPETIRASLERGEPYVLVAHALSREDAEAAIGASAIVVTTGGITADAAVMARALSKPCIVSATLRIFGDTVSSDDGAPLPPGAHLRVDGHSGELFVISSD